jgi:hypothetical protein
MDAFTIPSAVGLLALAFVLAVAWLADTSAPNCPPQLAEGKDALARPTVGGQNTDKRDRNPTVNAA